MPPERAGLQPGVSINIVLSCLRGYQRNDVYLVSVVHARWLV